MEALFYFIGIIIAISATIYFVDAAHRIKDRKGSPGKQAALKSKVKTEYKYPRTKFCPCCGAHLEQHEALVATIYDEKGESGKQKVLIHGCKFCNKKESKKKNSGITLS